MTNADFGEHIDQKPEMQTHLHTYRVPARRDGLTEELGSSQDPLAERPGVMTFGSAYPYYYGASRSGGLLDQSFRRL